MYNGAEIQNRWILGTFPQYITYSTNELLCLSPVTKSCRIVQSLSLARGEICAGFVSPPTSFSECRTKFSHEKRIDFPGRINLVCHISLIISSEESSRHNWWICPPPPTNWAWASCPHTASSRGVTCWTCCSRNTYSQT